MAAKSYKHIFQSNTKEIKDTHTHPSRPYPTQQRLFTSDYMRKAMSTWGKRWAHKGGRFFMFYLLQKILLIEQYMQYVGLSDISFLQYESIVKGCSVTCKTNHKWKAYRFDHKYPWFSIKTDILNLDSWMLTKRRFTSLHQPTTYVHRVKNHWNSNNLSDPSCPKGAVAIWKKFIEQFPRGRWEHYYMVLYTKQP